MSIEKGSKIVSSRGCEGSGMLRLAVKVSVNCRRVVSEGLVLSNFCLCLVLGILVSGWVWSWAMTK